MGHHNALRLLCIASYYQPAYVYGGPAHSVPALCAALMRAGADVAVFTTNANGPGRVLPVPAGQPIDVDGVPVRYFPVRWPAARIVPFYAPALGQAFRRDAARFDAVYFVGTWTHPMAAASIARRARVPYVVSPRGSFMEWAMGHKALKKRLYLALRERALVDGAAALHCTSELEREQQARWGFKPPAVVIPNGVDPAPYARLPARGALRQALGIPPGADLTLFVGRLHREKRIDLILDAFARVAGARPGAHLLVVGPDQDGSGAAARAQAQRLGLEARVHFTGLLAGEDLLQAHADADLLVLLSHRENFGMAAVEAMAAGLPVLLTREVGLAREVAQAGAGCAVAAEPEAAAQAWGDLLASPDGRRAMGARGRALVAERFAAGAVAAQMLALFERVAAAARRAPA